MPETGTAPDPGTSGARSLREGPHRGIHAIRRSLGLGDREQALVSGAQRRLRPYVEGWIDAFYARLLTDPSAMLLLQDDARVIRLKRSLTAWLHELFSLPFDESYERAREAIGDAHLRIEMPPYLMVTAMSAMRADMTRGVEEAYADDPAQCREVVRALGLALDMELALMLNAFRRRERAVARRHDRAVYAQRAARRFAHLLFDRVDAALCYAELAGSVPERRDQSLAKLRDILRGLAHFDRRLQERADVDGMSARRMSLAALCAQAITDVSRDPSTSVEIEVTPYDLEATLVTDAVQLAVEELVQNAAVHAPGSCVRVECCAREPDRTLITVTDEGPGWGPDVHEFKDLYGLGSGLGLTFCELVAELHGGTIELFEAPGGGAGIRLELVERRDGAGPEDA
jgi:signal transduction histidine kinase